MEPIDNGIELTGTLFTSAQGDAKDKLAYAEQIWDNDLKKSQKEINASIGKLNDPNAAFLPTSLSLTKGIMLNGNGVVTDITPAEEVGPNGFNITVSSVLQNQDSFEGASKTITIPMASDDGPGLMPLKYVDFFSRLDSSQPLQGLYDIQGKGYRESNYIELLTASSADIYTGKRGDGLIIGLPMATPTLAGAMSGSDKTTVDIADSLFTKASDNTFMLIGDSADGIESGVTATSDSMKIQLVGMLPTFENTEDGKTWRTEYGYLLFDFPAATTEKAGVMSAGDKQNLDAAASLANSLHQKEVINIINDAVGAPEDSGVQIPYYTLSNSGPNIWESIKRYFGINPATSTSAGVMSANDKKALDLIKDYSINSKIGLVSEGITTDGYSVAIYEKTVNSDLSGTEDDNNALEFTIPYANSTTRTGGLMSGINATRIETLTNAVDYSKPYRLVGNLNVSATETNVSLDFDKYGFQDSVFNKIASNINIPSATTESAGVMTAADKIALNNKADREELSNVIAREILNETNFEEVTDVTKDEVKLQLFCDLFNAEAGDDGYAKITNGTFDCELNGVPLTLKEAIAVYVAPRLRGDYTSTTSNQWLYENNKDIKTIFPYRNFHNTKCQYTFSGCTNLEVVNANIVARELCFRKCSNLKTLNIHSLNDNVAVNSEIGETYDGCYNLRNVTVEVTYRRNINLLWCVLLTLDSFKNIISKTIDGTTAFTITVHPNVYSKINDATNTAWHELVTLAADKNITFATA